MKNLFTPSLICISICMLFSSCNSTLSIVKRHYRSGFYVNHVRHIKTSHFPNEGEKTAEIKRMPTLHSLPYPAKQNAIEENINQDPKTGNITMIAGTNEKTQFKPFSHPDTKQLLKQINSIAESPAVQFKQSFSESNDHDGSGERAALSLLWIVILIILILWLVGILAGDFGIGGLINILLVIALVLLILWLLRIA